jgi:hypothetical protein
LVVSLAFVKEIRKMLLSFTENDGCAHNSRVVSVGVKLGNDLPEDCGIETYFSSLTCA